MSRSSWPRNYRPVEGWGRLPDGWSFIDATSVAVDNDDRVYVFNRGDHPVVVFEHTGEFVASWGGGLFATPHAITMVAGEKLWLTDYADQTIRCFMRDGALVRTIGQRGVSSPAHSGRPFNMPTDIAESPASGDLFISDGYRNSAVHRFSADGRHILSWGRPGTRPGQFNIPHNIGVGSDGRVYVADRENHRIQVFDEDGAYLDQINNLHRPCALYAHPKEALLFVGELPSRIRTNQDVPNIGACVSILTLDGDSVARIGGRFAGEDPGEFVAPHGVAVDSKGAIYVAEVAFQARGRHEDPPRVIRSLQKFVPLEASHVDTSRVVVP